MNLLENNLKNPNESERLFTNDMVSGMKNRIFLLTDGQDGNKERIVDLVDYYCN